MPLEGLELGAIQCLKNPQTMSSCECDKLDASYRSLVFSLCSVHGHLGLGEIHLQNCDLLLLSLVLLGCRFLTSKVLDGLMMGTWIRLNTSGGGAPIRNTAVIRSCPMSFSFATGDDDLRLVLLIKLLMFDVHIAAPRTV